MEFKKLKIFNYINASKKFSNYLDYTFIDIPTMGSHRDNMCFVFT